MKIRKDSFLKYFIKSSTGELFFIAIFFIIIAPGLLSSHLADNQSGTYNNIIFTIVIIILPLLIIIPKIHKTVSLYYLMPKFRQSAQSLGYNFTESTSYKPQTRNGELSPLIGFISGKVKNRSIRIYHSNYRINSKKQTKITVFESDLSANIPNLQLSILSPFSKKIHSLLTGGKTLYKDQFLIKVTGIKMPDYMELKSLLSSTLSDSFFYNFTQLSGKNTLEINNNKIRIIRFKVIYELNEVQKYISLLSMY